MNWRIFSEVLGESSKLKVIQHYVFVAMMAVILRKETGSRFQKYPGLKTNAS